MSKTEQLENALLEYYPDACKDKDGNITMYLFHAGLATIEP